MSPDTTAVPATLDDILAAIRDLGDRLAAPPAELLDRESLAALLGIGASTLDRYREAGEIGPRPVRLGGALRWSRHEVSAWLAHRDSAGDLHDRKTWPAVWETIQRKASIAGR